MVMPSSTVTATRSCRRRVVPCATSLLAGLLPWADTSRSVITAASSRLPTTHAEIATVPSARLPPRQSGWRIGKRNCCQSNIITSSLRSRRRSTQLPCRIGRWSTACCSDAAAETLQQIAADPKHLGAEIGFLAVLHAWGQNLQYHPHVHCVVPGGGLSPDGSNWVPCKPGFFLPVRVFSRLFRGKFLALLKFAFDQGKISFHGKIASLTDPVEFQRRLTTSAKTEWVVYAKPPFGGPEQVLKYLARYTHRVAISNHRLIALDDGEITFDWKDYAHDEKKKTMTLNAIEFIRRFLLHVLPAGFVRIRHYGFLANRVCRKKLDLCRALLLDTMTPSAPGAEPAPEPKDAGEGELAVHLCPTCGEGRMIVVEILPTRRVDRRGPLHREPTPERAAFDTS